jgi:hypothetical protein
VDFPVPARPVTKTCLRESSMSLSARSKGSVNSIRDKEKSAARSGLEGSVLIVIIGVGI